MQRIQSIIKKKPPPKHKEDHPFVLARDDGADVRLAKPADFHEISFLQARAFREDALFNYFGNHPRPLPSNPHPSDPAAARFADLQAFFEALNYAVHRAGGVVTVVYRPVSGKLQEEPEWVFDPRIGRAIEHPPLPPQEMMFCAFAVLMPNKKRVANSAINLLLPGFWRTAIKWGLDPIKKVAAACDDAWIEAFKRRGVDFKQSWSIQLIGTDPVDEGKGYVVMLMHDLSVRVQHCPLTILVTSKKARDILMQPTWDFEVTEEMDAGTGQVNVYGLPPVRGQRAEGVPIWAMTKWKW